MTLTDFLLARIAEDESLVIKDPPSGTFRPWELTQIDDSRSWDLLAMSHRRVLAECEAKRRIVALHEPIDYGTTYSGAPTVCRPCQEVDGYGCESVGDRGAWPCDTIKALAAVYVDHPDYRDEWKP